MRLVKLVVIFTNLAWFLSGCWDLKDLQDVNYFTAIGFDYVDEQYVIYVQLLDFASVAKMEGTKVQEAVPVWIGKGEGETPVSAINSLYESSQLHVFYGHINAIVYTERILKRGLEEVLDVLSRFEEMRYTPWVYATDTPLDELFTVTPFFFLSPMVSLLHQPKENYKQQSTIKPITQREFILTFHEPGRIVLLPSLNINRETWKEAGKDSPLLTIDGVHLFDRKRYKGRLSRSQVMGLRWVNADMQRSQLVVRSKLDDGVMAVISLENLRVKTISEVEGEDITYHIHVKMKGEILQLIRPTTEADIVEQAEKHVRDQILTTFKEGLHIQADLLQLEHTLYRQHTKLWKKMREQGEFSLADVHLDVHVNVDLTSSVKLKMEVVL